MQSISKKTGIVSKERLMLILRRLVDILDAIYKRREVLSDAQSLEKGGLTTGQKSVREAHMRAIEKHMKALKPTQLLELLETVVNKLLQMGGWGSHGTVPGTPGSLPSSLILEGDRRLDLQLEELCNRINRRLAGSSGSDEDRVFLTERRDIYFNVLAGRLQSDVSYATHVLQFLKDKVVAISEDTCRFDRDEDECIFKFVFRSDSRLLCVLMHYNHTSNNPMCSIEMRTMLSDSMYNTSDPLLNNQLRSVCDAINTLIEKSKSAQQHSIDREQVGLNPEIDAIAERLYVDDVNGEAYVLHFLQRWFSPSARNFACFKRDKREFKFGFTLSSFTCSLLVDIRCDVTDVRCNIELTAAEENIES